MKTYLTYEEMLKTVRSARKRFPSRVSYLTPVDKRLLTQLDQLLNTLLQLKHEISLAGFV